VACPFALDVVSWMAWNTLEKVADESGSVATFAAPRRNGVLVVKRVLGRNRGRKTGGLRC